MVRFILIVVEEKMKVATAVRQLDRISFGYPPTSSIDAGNNTLDFFGWLFGKQKETVVVVISFDVLPERRLQPVPQVRQISFPNGCHRFTIQISVARPPKFVPNDIPCINSVTVISRALAILSMFLRATFRSPRSILRR